MVKHIIASYDLITDEFTGTKTPLTKKGDSLKSFLTELFNEHILSHAQNFSCLFQSNCFVVKVYILHCRNKNSRMPSSFNKFIPSSFFFFFIEAAYFSEKSKLVSAVLW